MKKRVITKATGGWGFYFEATREQAEDILKASDGDLIQLAGENETLKVGRLIMGHWKRKGDGGSYEELVAVNVREKLNELIQQSDRESEEL